MSRGDAARHIDYLGSDIDPGYGTVAAIAAGPVAPDGLQAIVETTRHASAGPVSEPATPSPQPGRQR